MGAAVNSVGTTTTFGFMPFPDDPDDDSGFIPPLPQEDRLWRHPSEMSASSAPMVPAQRRRSPRSGLIAFLVLGVVTSVLTLAAVTSSDSSDPAIRSSDFAIGPAADDAPEAALASTIPAIVQIMIDGPNSDAVATGLMIRADGHVITASDPLKNARSITVVMSDGRSFNAIVVGTDGADDLAVIDIEGSDLPTPKFGDIASIDEGAKVYVVGRTESDRRAWVAPATYQSSGLRMDTADGGSLHDMIGSTLDAQMPAISAVLCTTTGEVVGLITSRAPSVARISNFASTSSTLILPSAYTAFAHPISWMTRVADELIDSGAVHQAWLGVLTTDAAEGGAHIEAITPSSPASAAALDAGDRIVALNESTVRSSSDLVVALRHFLPGDRVRFTVVRGDATFVAQVRLSDRS